MFLQTWTFQMTYSSYLLGFVGQVTGAQDRVISQGWTEQSSGRHGMCSHEGKQTYNQCSDNLCLCSARERSYSSYHEWRDSVFHWTELSCGLVLVRTLELCLLGVNGVPFVQSVTCAGILTGYQSICGTGGHKKQGIQRGEGITKDKIL